MRNLRSREISSQFYTRTHTYLYVRFSFSAIRVNTQKYNFKYPFVIFIFHCHVIDNVRFFIFRLFRSQGNVAAALRVSAASAKTDTALSARRLQKVQSQIPLGNACITNLCQLWINYTPRDVDVFIEKRDFLSLWVKKWNCLISHLFFEFLVKLHLNHVCHGLIFANWFHNLMSSAYFAEWAYKMK